MTPDVDPHMGRSSVDFTMFDDVLHGDFETGFQEGEGEVTFDLQLFPELAMLPAMLPEEFITVPVPMSPTPIPKIKVKCNVVIEPCPLISGHGVRFGSCLCKRYCTVDNAMLLEKVRFERFDREQKILIGNRKFYTFETQLTLGEKISPECTRYPTLSSAEHFF